MHWCCRGSDPRFHLARKKPISIVTLLWVTLQRSTQNKDSQPGWNIIKDSDPPRKCITILYKLFSSLGFSFLVC